MKDKNTTLVSEEMNEVMGAMPAWGMRWGSLMLFLAILLLLAIAAFIRYPDYIYGAVTITPLHTSTDVLLPAGKTITRFFVKDQEVISQHQPLFLTGDKDTIYAPAPGTIQLQSAATSGPARILTIFPAHPRYQAAVTLPAAGAGRIQLHQPVTIRLNDYPEKEFGSITGTVLSRPDNNRVEVALDREGKTNYDQQLHIDKAISGTAAIAVNDQSLLRRFIPL
jgi:hypothetical protein